LPEPAGREPIITAELEELALPAYHNANLIRAMVQDPFRVFIYWETRQESLFSSEELGEFRTVLRLIEIRGGNEAFFEVGRRGRYWMTVFPDREYEFQIGVRSSRHGYIALARSNRVRTPRGTISPRAAREADYQISPEEFARVLEASGFAAHQVLNITIEATAGIEPQQDQLRSLFEGLPSSVRAALLALSRGQELTFEMVLALPEPLRGQLLELFRAGGPKVAAAGLAHYLPELLRELMADEREWIGDPIHPLHLLPKFFIGGTEQLARPQARWPGSTLL
jgi:hypothetical protein